MKRIWSLILSCCLMVSCCWCDAYAFPANKDSNFAVKKFENEADIDVYETWKPEFSRLDDKELFQYLEDSVYSELVAQLDSNEYFVENIESVYISKEYLEELAYNSEANVFFGYTLEELEEQYQGERYVFSLGANGDTEVSPLEDYDDTYEKALRDIAIGSGVILMCVTVSVVTGGAAPAVSMIFGVSAKTGTVAALSSGTISGVASGIVTGMKTKNFGKALKAGISDASKGFKWAALSGSIMGGAGEAFALHGATLNGLTMNEAAIIQRESRYPISIIKQFHSTEEYRVFRDANLESMMVGNKTALVKADIDLMKIDSKNRTNLERMRQGLAPQDSNGISYELHHIGQRKDGTLAILSRSEHDNPAIHGFLQRTEVHATGTNWDVERQTFWKTFAALVG